MSETESSMPQGYTLHDFQGRDDFSVRCGPFYTQPLEGGIRLALRLEERHCNLFQEAHGGIIAAMADIAMSICLKAHEQAPASVATLELSVRYFATVKLGYWLRADAKVNQIGRNFGFATVDFYVGDKQTAQASGTCKVLSEESLQRRLDK